MKTYSSLGGCTFLFVLRKNREFSDYIYTFDEKYGIITLYMFLSCFRLQDA
jgi:hypothetical protein